MKQFTEAQLVDLNAKASGLFQTLVGLTTTPREAAEIICMMHMLLFLNYGDGKATCDIMLEDYCKNFRANWEHQLAHGKEGMN